MRTLARPHVLGALLVGFAAIAALPGCRKAPPTVAKSKDPEVEVEKPVTRAVTDHEDFTGHIEAIPTVDLRAQVSGYLKAAHFREGTDVKKGDLLLEIDSIVYDAELARAKSLVTQAEAHYDRLTSDYNRVIRVRDKGTVTQEEIDRIKGDREEAFAAIGVAKAGQTLAEQNVEFTKIRAPFDGRIGKRMIDPNNLVKANDTVLATLVSLDPIYATFDVDEHTVLRLRDLIHTGSIPSLRANATNVIVSLADEDIDDPNRRTRELIGVIDFSDPRFESGTGTLRLRAKLNNVPLTSPGIQAALAWASGLIGYDFKPRLSNGMLLSPGMFCRIRLPIGTPHPAVLIPEEALGADQGQRYVFVLNDKDEVVYRAVTLGPPVGRLRVIEKGVSADDRVIVRGLQRVRSGIKVRAKPAEPLQ